MMRLSLGLSSLTVSLLFAAHAVGLLPDRAADLNGRKALCESLAVACSLAAQRDDRALIENVIRAVVGRNPEIISAAVRRTDGDLLVAVGDHRNHWGEAAGKRSTPTHMHVPIALGDKPWGSIEVRFRPFTRFCSGARWSPWPCSWRRPGP
jgi:hypothetical protein